MSSEEGLDARLAALWAAEAGDHACWLDGGSETRSIFGLRPDMVIEGDDLALLDPVEAIWREEPHKPWIGFVTYDLGASTLLERPPGPGRFAGLVMRRFDRFLRVEPDGSWMWEGGERALPPPLPSADWSLGPLRPCVEPEVYRARVRAAKEFIRAGDTYQVNLAQRFTAAWQSGAPRQARRREAQSYLSLRRRSAATMGALIAVDGERGILSNSPETLLEVSLGRDGTADRASSWPIKGTRPRHADPGADHEAAAELAASEKERAEHVMIVDLVRNDLGRLALPGSVCAPQQPERVALATVHHLVSEVRCALRPGWTLRQLFRAVFPGASITGAPKRRTVSIIDALEGEPRGVYCGAIVLLDRDGLRASIPIRTALLDDAGLQLHSGGGIVADSEPEPERLETLAKARAFEAPSH